MKNSSEYRYTASFGNVDINATQPENLIVDIKATVRSMLKGDGRDMKHVFISGPKVNSYPILINGLGKVFSAIDDQSLHDQEIADAVLLEILG